MKGVYVMCGRDGWTPTYLDAGPIKRELDGVALPIQCIIQDHDLVACPHIQDGNVLVSS